jgi:hypothetical protein
VAWIAQAGRLAFMDEFLSAPIDNIVRSTSHVCNDTPLGSLVTYLYPTGILCVGCENSAVVGAPSVLEGRRAD